jgi:hypothetical protein
MHADAAVGAALELRSIGMSVAWIARELGIPRRTLGEWFAGNVPRRRTTPPTPIPPADYAYLLGLYLGDGHISRHCLRISCDAAYPGIIAAAQAAIDAVNPGRPASLVPHPVHRCISVWHYSKRWPALFPQHGPGRKHARPIVLTAWQRDIAATHARELVRGLIHSDGSRFIANQRVAGRVYRYVRYAFNNRSADVLAIFCEHLDLLDIAWSSPRDGYIAVDRRSEVAKLDEFVGPKR